MFPLDVINWLDSEVAANVEQDIWCPSGRAGSNPVPGVLLFRKTNKIMGDLKIRLVTNRKELEEVFRLRRVIFIRGQGVPKELEYDGLDREAKHVIVLYKGKSIGCSRLRFRGDKVRWERFGILKKYRGRGFGKELTTYIINYCRRSGARELFMHAQYYLLDFYREFGFKIRGKPFMEAGIKHIEMYMRFQ